MLTVKHSSLGRVAHQILWWIMELPERDEHLISLQKSIFYLSYNAVNETYKALLKPLLPEKN